MAAKPLPHATKDAIITDWRLGQMSMREIADKHSISLGSVCKLCKGVAQDVEPIVNAAIQYRQALFAHDERIVNAVESHVDIVVSRLEYLNRQAMQNVQEAMDAKCEGQTDFRSRALTINAAKETLVGKTPDTAIQINNQNSAMPQKIVRTIVDPRPQHPDAEGIRPAS
ncbi:MAG: hypothetical protein ACYCY2_05695 [Acidithiobacillus ferriphilus]